MLALRRQGQADLLVQSQPGLWSELQDSSVTQWNPVLKIERKRVRDRKNKERLRDNTKDAWESHKETYYFVSDFAVHICVYRFNGITSYTRIIPPRIQSFTKNPSAKTRNAFLWVVGSGLAVLARWAPMISSNKYASHREFKNTGKVAIKV